MNQYVNLIRKYKLDSILLTMSNISRKQILEHEIVTEIEIKPRFKNTKGHTFWLIPWDLMSISFDAISYTNDYRGNELDINGVISLQNIYRGIDKDRSKEELEKIDESDLLAYIIYGHSQEEFWMQVIYNETINFNRNMELLKIGRTIYKDVIDSAFLAELNMSMDEYYEAIWLLYAWGLKSSDFSNVEEICTFLRARYSVNEANLRTVLNYYSGDIEYFKSHRFGKNVFLIKPFIVTNSGRVILSSLYYLLRLLSFGAYWVSRNHYFKLKSQKFTNAFGVMYEQYFERFLKHYLSIDQFERIEEQIGLKLVDWKITTSNFVVLIEQKTSLARMTSKTLYPNLEEMKSYFERISEGVVQLDSTKRHFENENEGKRVVKFLVLYEELYVHDGLIDSIMEYVPEGIEKDVVLLGTREFEVLVQLISEDEVKFEDLMYEKIRLDTERSTNGRTISQLIERFDIKQSGYATGVLSYYSEFAEKTH